jgi:hypothetical protein
VDVTVSATPATARIHADGEHRWKGKVIDQAGHDELCPGPRSFPLAGLGVHTIDIRVINFEATSIKPLVSATLFDAKGAIVDGPVPCQRTVPANDHYLVTILANVQQAPVAGTGSAVVGGVAAPAPRASKARRRSRPKKSPRTKKGGR